MGPRAHGHVARLACDLKVAKAAEEILAQSLVMSLCWTIPVSHQQAATLHMLQQQLERQSLGLHLDFQRPTVFPARFLGPFHKPCHKLSCHLLQVLEALSRVPPQE